MRKEQALRRRLKSLGTLSDAVGAMRSLSAHHFRLARAELSTARIYRDEIMRAVDDLDVDWPGDIAGPTAVVLLTTDLGLCGDYSSRLTSFLISQEPRDCVVYCVGRRSRGTLEHAGMSPAAVYQAPTSVAGMPHVLLNLVEELLVLFTQRRAGGLTVVSARFDGAGRFTPISTPVIPVRGSRKGRRTPPSPYVERSDLVSAAVREFLHISMYELFLDALAAEYGMRLVSAEAAQDWLDDEVRVTSRELAASRREDSTQELLDIVSAAVPVRKMDRSRR